MTTLAVLQPGYLPWLGYFEQLDRADIFVHYDDVQYDKGGWRNRNRIKTASGAAWLTVPVSLSGHFACMLNAVEIDNKRKWTRKHLETIRQNYSRAPFFSNYFADLEDLLNRSWENLVELNFALIEKLSELLKVNTETHKSSSIKLDGDRDDRLIQLCQYFEADNYLTGDSAKSYLREDKFKAIDVKVEWQNYQHPTYPQMYGDFSSHLSVIDLLFNCGDHSLEILRNKKMEVT